MRNIETIKRELDNIKYESDTIRKEVDIIKDKVVDHTPEHFSNKDLIRATIGALFLGFSVLFSGNIANLATKIPTEQLYVIVLATVFILSLEIYIIGYSKVKDKSSRAFGQFLIKRLLSFYSIALIISTMLSLIFGLYYIVPGVYFINFVIILSAPCAIGASLGDLLKKY